MGIWSTYKSAARKQKHTGGGDGDELTFTVDFDDAGVPGSEDEDLVKKTEAGSTKPNKPKTKRQPSGKALEDFAKSTLFEKIDAV